MDPNEKIQLDDITFDDVIGGDGVDTVAEVEPIEEVAEQKEDLGITPIGIPLIAGPGAITSVMLLSSQTSNFYDKCILHTNIILILIITLLILLLGKRMAISIGTTGIRIIQRIMGLILLVISIQFIINGIIPLIS